MKLVTFRVPSLPNLAPRVGALTTDGLSVVDLRGLEPELPTQMIGLLEAGQPTLDAAAAALRRAEQLGKAYPLSDVKLLAPLLRPRTIRDFMTFETHASQARKLPPAWYEFPIYYKGSPESVIGPEDEIPWPSYTQRLDYELELGMYIGKEGRDIPKERARQHIAGFTVFNDVSARDIQMKEMSVMLGPAKGKDFCNIMGPCLVTPDEVDDMDLRMVARINGEVWSEGNSGTRRYTWEDMIAWASTDETLHPGEFFGSGTVGLGCGLELNRWIQPGDLVELEIEGIGVLRNRVGQPRRPQ